MSDDITPGELDRRMRDHEQRTVIEHKTIHDRIGRISTESVQLDVHAQVEKDRDREIKALEQRVRALETKPGITWGRAMAGVTVVIAILALMIQAYSTVRGIK